MGWENRRNLMILQDAGRQFGPLVRHWIAEGYESFLGGGGGEIYIYIHIYRELGINVLDLR